MTNERAPARKVAIKPITIVVEMTVEKVSEKGTFSGIKVTSVKSDVKELAGHLRAAVPPQGGGAMYVITDSLKGLNVLGEVGKVAKPEVKKLF